MEIVGYVLLIIAALLIFAAGFYVGVEKTFLKICTIGTLKVAHDENDEKYLAIVIDPLHKDILDGNKNGPQMIYVEHVYSEVKNDKT